MGVTREIKASDGNIDEKLFMLESSKDLHCAEEKA